jgi:hypothetical protein
LGDFFSPQHLVALVESGWVNSGRSIFKLSTLLMCSAYISAQGCQIFLGTTYQNGENMYQMTTKYTQMAIKCFQWS